MLDLNVKLTQFEKNSKKKGKVSDKDLDAEAMDLYKELVGQYLK
jgi:hypothetical protein